MLAASLKAESFNLSSNCSSSGFLRYRFDNNAVKVLVLARGKTAITIPSRLPSPKVGTEVELVKLR